MLGTYDEDFYKNMPALLHNRYKAGNAYYLGCRDTGELSDTLYAQILSQLNIQTYDLPEGVSIHSRDNYLFIENYNDHAVTVNLPGTYRNIETEQLYNDTVCVEPYNIVIVGS